MTQPDRFRLADPPDSSIAYLDRLIRHSAQEHHSIPPWSGGTLWEDIDSQNSRRRHEGKAVDPGPLDLRDYLSILWARKWTIIAIAATTTAVALAYSFRQTPLYTATAEVVVLPASFAPTDPSAGSLTLNMLTEQQVANSTTVKQEASDRLAQLDIPPGTMSATQVEGAETLVFTSVSSDPKAAQATAEAQADAYLDLRRNALIDGLNAARAPYESQIRAIDAELVQFFQHPEDGFR